MQEHNNTFADVVNDILVEPIKELLELFSEEESYNEFAFFSNLLFMLSDPEDEASVLEAVLELSKCAFLGLTYSFEAQIKIDSILERAITLSHTMSVPDDNIS